ncbi:POK7 protein, partial [Rhipidura dahli]|nr:POK7 protein [Rhipidura dahli]
MGALQPGLPNPAMVPKGWQVLVVDLKDCFFTIPLVSVGTNAPLSKFTQAQESHLQFHQNARGLHKQFGITLEEAKGIVRTCPACSHQGAGLG